MQLDSLSPTSRQATRGLLARRARAWSPVGSTRRPPTRRTAALPLAHMSGVEICALGSCGPSQEEAGGGWRRKG